MQVQFEQVDQNAFHNTVKALAGRKIKQQAHKTVLYDAKNRVLAFLKPPAVQPNGLKPTQYFVRKNCP